VFYIYVDVFLLFVCAAAAETPWLRSSHPVTAWAATLAISVALVVGVAWFTIADDLVIRHQESQALITERARRDRVVEIDYAPAPGAGDAPQQLTPVLNGTPLGTVALPGGSHRFSVPAPARLWQIGVNQLDFTLSPADRRPSVVIERVAVRPR
jgi:hypothetical protein